MGFLRRLFGGGDENREMQGQRQTAPQRQRGFQDNSRLSEDERAIERYRYMLRTAPPDTVEEAHAEAFGQLTPEQRQMVLQELTTGLPERERLAAEQAGDDPRSLARTATRAEMRQPGTMERTFSGMSNRPGMGGMFAGGFFGSFAGIMVGSMIAQSFFDNDSGSDSGESGGDSGDSGDSGGVDDQSADAGGDFGGDTGGDFGGDFGGGDFGGGDFGGGDFGGGDF